MAHELHQGVKTAFKAASAVGNKRAVAIGAAAGQVVPISSAGQRPEGVTIASALQGESVPVYGFGNTVKAVAGASLGFGADVGVATTGGQLSIVTAASGVAAWVVGETREPAAAGETFSLYVNPRRLDAQS